MKRLLMTGRLCIALLCATARAGAAGETPAGQTQGGAPSSPPPPAATEAAKPETPPVKVTVYGILYFNGFHNSGGTNNADVPMWATAGNGDTSASARQSRFGLRVALPSALGAKTTAVLEADFFGGFPATGVGENFGQLRLRLANARLDWEKTSLVVGQDWMVFAPANPISLASAGIPLLAASGNPWSRLPQVRLERRLGLALVQGAVLAPQTGDFNSSFLAQPNSGASSKLPFFQARLSVAPKDFLGSGKPLTLGLSGHYGQSRVTPSGGTPVDLASQAVALDWSIPLGRFVVVAGEAFAGDNLAGFQAGIFQGINPDAVSGPDAPGAPRAISTRGGWVQVTAGPFGSRVSLSAAYGVDDPGDKDLESATVRPWRRRNQVMSLGASCNASAQLSFGVEYRFLETRPLAGTPKDHHLNLAAVLAF